MKCGFALWSDMGIHVEMKLLIGKHATGFKFSKIDKWNATPEYTEIPEWPTNDIPEPVWGIKVKCCSKILVEDTYISRWSGESSSDLSTGRTLSGQWWYSLCHFHLINKYHVLIYYLDVNWNWRSTFLMADICIKENYQMNTIVFIVDVLSSTLLIA